MRNHHTASLDPLGEGRDVDASVDMDIPPANHVDQSSIGPDVHSYEVIHARQDPPLHETNLPSGTVNVQEAGVLSAAVIYELKEIWFSKYHPWFPILHQPSFDKSLDLFDPSQSTDFALIVQAIVAVTLQQSHIIEGDVEWKRHRQDQLVNEVVVHCIGRSSLSAVQALLIISILQYGRARHVASWNILAIARRLVS